MQIILLKVFIILRNVFALTIVFELSICFAHYKIITLLRRRLRNVAEQMILLLLSLLILFNFAGEDKVVFFFG